MSASLKDFSSFRTYIQSVRSIQSVQNAAARLVTFVRRCDHITPTLRQLHWLPVRQRVLVKLAVMVFWVWNSLPAELRQCDSLGQFKQRLKTYLFGIWDHGAL